MEKLVEWPTTTYTRIPFRLFHDPEIYRLEMERIFRGPVWNYLCLDAEIPEPGDYRTTWVGDISVVVTRAADGAIRAFENRCGHRGAQIVRTTHGNASEHVCIYHRWCYSQEGKISGIPFRRGLKGKGGMPADFDKSQYDAPPMRVEIFHGVVFATFSIESETLHDYLGEFGRTNLARIFHKPVVVHGYSRQRIRGNWKLYAENLRDTYHASLLHEFFVTYGVDRATQKGGVKMDARHRHNMNHAYAQSDTAEDAKSAYSGIAGVEMDRMRLTDDKLLQYVPEFEDGMNLAAPTIFPNSLFIQINNSLSTRQIRTKGVGEFEIYQTLFGYADDSEAMTRHRLVLSNLVGPAGLVSMEDGEAIEIVHRTTATRQDQCSVIEMGGRGELGDLDHRVTESPIRGFWSYWAELMGCEPDGAIR